MFKPGDLVKRSVEHCMDFFDYQQIYTVDQQVGHILSLVGFDGWWTASLFRLANEEKPASSGPVYDAVNAPKHYLQLGATCDHCGGEVQPIVITRQLMGNCAQAVQYIIRSPNKGSAVQDLEKAVWFIQDEIKRLNVAASKSA